MAIKIGHSSIDENGKAVGGAAGDQTKKEVCIRNWYKASWDAVLRPKSADIAEKSAVFVEGVCANDNIGYDQGQRNTLYAQAVPVNYDASAIKVKCECDCSSLMHTAVMASGAKLTYGSNGFTTRTMIDKLVESGDYEKLTDSKYLTSDEYLKRGDILVNKGNHTVMALENGSGIATVTPTTPNNTASAPALKLGDVVSISVGATYYNSTKKVPDWVLKKQWVVKNVSGSRVVIDKSTDGKSSICSAIDKKYLTIVRAPIIVPQKTLAIGATVSIKTGATYYNSTKKVPDWVLKKHWIVKAINNDRVVIDKSTDNKSSICSPIAASNLSVI